MLVSVTVRVFERLPVTTYLLAYNTTADSDSYWSLNTYFHTQLPQLSESGLMGYYYGVPSFPGETNSSISGKVMAMFLAPEKSPTEVQDIMNPIEQHILAAKWGDPVYISHIVDDFSDFTRYWKEMQVPEAAGFSARLGSRLLDESALTTDFDALKEALRKASPAPWMMLGHLIAGPGVRSPPGGIAGGSNAVNPAWRDAYSHLGERPKNASMSPKLTSDSSPGCMAGT